MTLPAPTVRVLVCGSADRGDDGAALNAVAHILPLLDPILRQRVEVRRCLQLDAADLIDVAEGESCLVLDTVVGVEPGTVVDIPLDELTSLEDAAPRSSHALPISQVLGIAEAVRGQLPPGRLVGIGGKWFGFGATRSRALRDGMPAFELAAAHAIEELARPVPKVKSARPDAVAGAAPGRPAPLSGPTPGRPEPLSGPTPGRPEPLSGPTPGRPEPLSGPTGTR